MIPNAAFFENSPSEKESENNMFVTIQTIINHIDDPFELYDQYKKFIIMRSSLNTIKLILE